MIDVDKVKAVMEAMIFVSPEPVTVRQILLKIKTVLKKNPEELLLEGSEVEGLESEQAEETLQAQADVEETEEEVVEEVSAEVEEVSAEEVEVQAESQEEAEEVVETPSEDDLLPVEVTHVDVKRWLKEIQVSYKDDAARGFELISVAKGVQFRTKAEMAFLLRAEKKTLPSRLSPSAMETLAIVAYEQPVARSKVDDVRGVDSGGVLRTLLEKEFVRIVGRADEPGQPLLYGTTNKFLEVFQLKNLSEMPSLGEIEELHMDGDEFDPEAPAEYFDPDEVREERENVLSETEKELFGELDESLQQVKVVEKEIEFIQGQKKQEAAPEAPVTPEASETPEATSHE